MNKIKNKNTICFIPIIISLFSLVLNFVSFGTNDDLFIQNIAKSFETNSHSEHLMFISVVLGYLCKWMFKIIPSVNWLGVMYVGMLTTAMVLIYKIYQKSFNIFTLMILAFIQIYSLSRISFTTIAFLSVEAGMLFYLERINNIKLKHILTSAIFILIGLLFRNSNVFIFTILVFAPNYLFTIKHNKKNFKYIALLLAMCFAFSFSITQISNIYESKYPQETYYNEFQEYRSTASDEGLFDYDEHHVELEQNGISENDYNMFKSFIYASKTSFSNAKTKAIASRSFNDKYETNINNLIKSLLKYSKIKIVFLLLIISIFAFFITKKDKTKIALTTLTVLVAIFYLFFRRRGVERVVNPVSICGILIILSYFNLDLLNIQSTLFSKLKIKNTGLIKIIISIIYVFIITINPIIYSNSISLKDIDVDKYLENNKSTIFVTTPQVTNYNLVNYNLSLTNDKSYFDYINSIFGDWYLYTYYWYDMLDKAKLNEYKDDTFLAVLDKDVKLVYFDDKAAQLDMIKQYLKEHYSLEVEYNKEISFSKSKTAVYNFDLVE